MTISWIMKAFANLYRIWYIKLQDSLWLQYSDYNPEPKLIAWLYHKQGNYFCVEHLHENKKQQTLSHLQLDVLEVPNTLQTDNITLPEVCYCCCYWKFRSRESHIHLCVFSFWRLYSFYIYIYIYLEKEMATHSSTPAWKIPWMEEPGRLQSMGSLRIRHDWATSLHIHTHTHIYYIYIYIHLLYIFIYVYFFIYIYIINGASLVAQW